MDFRQFWRDLQQNALAAAVVFLLCCALGWAAAFLPADHYTAATDVVAEPTPGTLDPTGAVAVIQYVLPLLPAEATNVATVNAARAQLADGGPAATASVSASLEAGTGVVTVSATASSPSTAAALANAVVNQLKARQPINGLYELVQLSTARQPAGPSNTRLPIVIGAVGLGLIAAVFAALAAAAVRRRLNQAAEIRKYVGTDVVGEIPRLRDMRPSQLLASGTGLEMEVFQQLRSSLMFKTPADGPFTVAVTSCRPAEGKTFVAANLAWVLASEDTPAIALDCDVRRPMLHVRLSAPFGPGVCGNVADALQRIWWAPARPSLGMIPAGVSDRHPSDVIARHLPEITAELTKAGRIVVVDSPPIMGTAETALIASLVDLVVVVVDARKFDPEVLQECLNKLEGAGATVAGVVLNRIRLGRKENWLYGYGYDYGQRPERQAGRVAARSPAVVQVARPAHAQGASAAPARSPENGRHPSAWELKAPPRAADSTVEGPWSRPPTP